MWKEKSKVNRKQRRGGDEDEGAHHSEAADVTNGVGVALLGKHAGEAREDRRGLADATEHRRLAEARDVVRDGEVTVCAGAERVHVAGGDLLAVELLEFLDEDGVLE